LNARGKVFIVGAGPGDPKLITLRGRECLERADVVVYDRLVSPRLLRYVKNDAKLVYVGKSPGNHTLAQDEINQLLVDEALDGKIVTRLKGGDPFVFGRGGEEAATLVQHGIEFEVVPGITSAIAVPAYAGIPVTHRGLSQSFAVITGHGEGTQKDSKKETQINWSTLSESIGTLVFLMGVGQLPEIVRQLTTNGRTPQTPIALIRWGTRREQQTITGTLEDIVEQVLAADFQPPAVTIVGEVVRLRDQLAWIEKKPLFGKQIVITRATTQSSELARQIEELGGEPFEYPVIELADPDDWTNFDAAMTDDLPYDWLVFTSQNAVEQTFSRMRQLGKDVRTLYGVNIAAVGRSTVSALELRGLCADVVPDVYKSAALIPLLQDKLIPGQRVLWPRGDLAESDWAHQLRRREVHVADPVVYVNRFVTSSRGVMLRQLAEKEVDAITFTSASTVRNFLRSVDAESATDIAELLANVSVICMGPTTASAAQGAGFSVHRIAEEASISALVEAVVEEVGS